MGRGAQPIQLRLSGKVPSLPLCPPRSLCILFQGNQTSMYLGKDLPLCLFASAEKRSKQFLPPPGSVSNI